MSLHLRVFVALIAGFASHAAMACEIGVVGAGAGGAYFAWRAALSGKSVCIFELARRPGGRIHSLRGQGPARDLLVEAGAYRFAPKPVYANASGIVWKVSTPRTASIVKELGLRTAVYNPNASQWDHGMHKIVDEHGHDAGFLVLVEKMLNLAETHGAKVRYNTTVVRLAGAPNHAVVVQLASGEEVKVKTLLLNLPQHPVVELLRRSDDAIASIFPRPLYVPISTPLMKLYVHYDDAWWINDLGLVAGPFFNKDQPLNTTLPEYAPNQSPAPLQGQYHDGDVRCDGRGGRCRGYLQTFYGGDKAHAGAIEKSLSFYSTYHDSLSDEAVVHITPSKVHHRELLSEVHASLLEFHRSALDAVNATSRASLMRPASAVLSIWSQSVAGIQAGCHNPKGGNNPSPEDLPKAAVQPLPGWPIFVANEAFGHIPCFAEGSLHMAEEALKRMNISVPSLRTEPQPDEMQMEAIPVNTDPFLLPGGASLHPGHIDGQGTSSNSITI